MLKNKKKIIQFENNVKSTKYPLLGIVGTAGSGKTTYLNFLRYTFCSDYLFFHIVDLSSSSLKSIKFLDTTIDISDKAFDEFGMLFLSLARYISTLLSYEKSNPITILNSYREWYRESHAASFSQQAVKFFAILEKSVNDSKSFGTELAFFIADIFKSDSKKDVAISTMMQVIVCIMVSLARYGKRHICAIDNIEYLVRVENNSSVKCPPCKTRKRKTIVNQIFPDQWPLYPPRSSARALAQGLGGA